MTVTTTFVECVSCGREKVLGGAQSDAQAAKVAIRAGWTVRGFRGAKRTRCGPCRRKRRRDTRAADGGRIGNNAGWLSTGRAQFGGRR